MPPNSFAQSTLPPRLTLAQLPTPFYLLERLSKDIGKRVWVKRDDLTGGATSGNKIRKLEYTLAKAKADGCTRVITCGGLQSNHCRTTAILSAQLGLDVHLILRGIPDGTAEGNLFLDQLVGADISYHSVKEYQTQLKSLFSTFSNQYESLGQKTMLIPTGASDGVGIWGYVNAARELKNDFEQHGLEPSHIVTATGSGGTQAGLTLGCNLLELKAEVWGMAVCDDAATFKTKVREDITDWAKRYSQSIDMDMLAIHVNDKYIGPGYAKATQEIFDTISMVAKLEGLILDPVYTAKAFHGMLAELDNGCFQEAEDIVFIHTGGIFGLFPYRDDFSSE